MDPSLVTDPGTTPPPPAAAPGAAPAADPAAAPAAPAPPMPQTEHDTSLDDQRYTPQQAKTLSDEDLIKRDSWGVKVYHGVLSALGGSDDIAMQRDPNTGKMIVTAVKSGPGQQWKRIIAGAIGGAGAAMKGAGTGPGSIMRGAGLGVEAGEAQAQERADRPRREANEDFEIQQKTKQSNAQVAMLNQQTSTMGYQLGRSQVEARFSDAERENKFTEMIGAGGEGSTDLGIHPDFKSVVKATQDMPQLHDHQANGLVVSIPHVGADGKIDGMHYGLVTKTWMEEHNDQPLTYYELKPPTKPGEDPVMVPHIIEPGQISRADYLKGVMATNKDILDIYGKEQEAREKTATANAAVETAGARVARVPAQNAKDYADAQRAAAEGRKADSLTGSSNEVVDAIGTGQMDVGRMAYLLARNPELANQVVAKYPGFDNSKVSAYAKNYINFTSGKASIALNAGDAVLKHLLQLSHLNTPQSHVWGTPDFRAYNTQLDIVASDLGHFYGDSTIPAAAERRKNLGSIGLGRQKAIETQAAAMGEKMDAYAQQWKNSAPSDLYMAHMPGLSERAMTALETLDPGFSKSTLSEIAGQRRIQAARQDQPQQPQAPPGAQGGRLLPGGGAAPAMVTVQIPGHPPGQIPASNLANFKRDNPTATVTQ